MSEMTNERVIEKLEEIRKYYLDKFWVDTSIIESEVKAIDKAIEALQPKSDLDRMRETFDSIGVEYLPCIVKEGNLNRLRLIKDKIDFKADGSLRKEGE